MSRNYTPTPLRTRELINRNLLKRWKSHYEHLPLVAKTKMFDEIFNHKIPYFLRDTVALWKVRYNVIKNL